MQNKPLHVGLCGPLPPPYGGMANQLNQLYELLLNESIKVSLLQTNAPYPIKAIENVRGIRALFRLIPYFLKLWTFAGKVDVIHVFANSGWSWQLFAAPVVWLGWVRNTPVIVNYRGGEAGHYFSKSIRWVRPSLNKATIIVVPSGYLKTIFSDFGVHSIVIPNIINLERFKSNQLIQLDQNKPHVVITRNLEEIYGIAAAIKAIALVREVIPGIQLSIAGSGPQLAELQQLVQKQHLENNVCFTGKLTPEAVAELYKRADIMLNPTTVDNMPNSVLEAMACGVAIVTTNVGGIPYIVEHDVTALFAEVNNAESMTEQILRIINEPDLHNALVENGLLKIQQYSWENVKSSWLNLYANLSVKS